MMDETLFDLKSAAALRKGRQRETYLIEFIPQEMQKGLVEVPRQTLAMALAKWYQKHTKPLLASEIEAIFQRFRNGVVRS